MSKTADYGWLAPDGKYYAVQWGDHADFANRIVTANNWMEELEDYLMKNDNFKNGLAGDYLVYQKGWLLLHNPTMGIAKATYDNIKGITKAQREFLFDYYVQRNLEHLANEYWKEENLVC